MPNNPIYITTTSRGDVQCRGDIRADIGKNTSLGTRATRARILHATLHTTCKTTRANNVYVSIVNHRSQNN